MFAASGTSILSTPALPEAAREYRAAAAAVSSVVGVAAEVSSGHPEGSASLAC